MKELAMKENSKKIKKTHSKLLVSLSIAFLIILVGFIFVKRYAVDSFTEKAFTIYITPTTPYQELLDTLKNRVERSTYLRFKRLSRLDDYERKMIPGAYKLEPSMSAIEVYKILSHGLQTPVRVSFNNIRTIDQLSGRIASQLLFDSTAMMKTLSDTSFIHSLGFDKHTIGLLFLPDSYDFYWTITPQEFVQRMKKEYDRYWSDERIEKASRLGYSPNEIGILASIAEEETNDQEERGVVGRLYMNRLDKGMPLQADPTVKFALQDFSIRRILQGHLTVDSPYNTYKYAGLPPGPIRIPTKRTMDTLLKSEPHDFIYMCAKEDFSGKHNFAKTFDQHQINAARYRKALNNRGIQ